MNEGSGSSRPTVAREGRQSRARPCSDSVLFSKSTLLTGDEAGPIHRQNPYAIPLLACGQRVAVADRPAPVGELSGGSAIALEPLDQFDRGPGHTVARLHSSDPVCRNA